jgi:type VI secretion system protein ImpF
VAELSHKERLQPSLLDRLTDDEPKQRVEAREKRVLSVNQLRECVRRDLAWLFNTTNLVAVDPDLEPGYPLAARSVINYGIPDLAGRTVSGIDVAALERLLRQAIWDFEPRLVRGSVTVRGLVDEDMSHNAIAFSIDAELWAQPVPLRLYLRTQVDLEAGRVDVSEAGERRGS